MRHGYSISTIAIVAVVGVALVLAWMNYNSSAGINYEKRISDDKSSFKANMETVKEVAVPALKHAANDAALAVAESGGGMGTERVWFCNEIKAPPTLHEVVYALSNYTLTNFNTYLDDATEVYSVLGIETIPYTCSGCYPLLAPACPQTNYPIPCDGWNATATGGSIYAIEDDITHTYVGDVKAVIDSDRFFWMYYRLLEAEAENSILADIKKIAGEELTCPVGSNATECCITPQNLSAIYTGHIDSAKSKFTDHFKETPQYVTCEVITECSESLSWAIRIECTDKKYKIPGESETGERYMKWVIKEMISIGCGNLNMCIGAANAPAVPVPPSPANMAPYKSNDIAGDLMFAMTNSDCTEAQRCFDIDRCPTDPFDKQLCFNP